MPSALAWGRAATAAARGEGPGDTAAAASAVPAAAPSACTSLLGVADPDASAVAACAAAAASSRAAAAALAAAAAFITVTRLPAQRIWRSLMATAVTRGRVHQPLLAACCCGHSLGALDVAGSTAEHGSGSVAGTASPPTVQGRHPNLHRCVEGITRQVSTLQRQASTSQPASKLAGWGP